MKKPIVFLCILIVLPLLNLKAQKEDKKDEGYKFTILKKIAATPVKDQYRSGTCWSFATLSFLESELLRIGKGEYDLSEMFVANRNYHERAIDYVRYHGKKSFSGGAEAWDVLNVIKKYGLLPQEAYTGNTIGEQLPVHGEMDAVLKAYVDAVVQNKNRKITPVWIKGFDSILDAYMGDIPGSFSYDGETYTPESFRDQMGLNMDDYVTITSFSHHDFYTKFNFEGPDNWSLGEVYNVPFDKMMETIDNAISKGYTLAWGSDVSEKGFAFRKGVAIVPDMETKNMDNAEIAKWEKLSKKEKEEALYSFKKPVAEKSITQQMRQEAFDNYQSTEDHLMHMTGIAQDQNGNKFYLIKNSWSADLNDYEGYFYASVPFVQFKTISIMLHKDAIPDSIAHKLGLR